MKSNTTPTDIQSLTQDYYPAAYSLELQAEELAAADDFEGYTEWSEDLDAVWMAEQEKQAWAWRKARHLRRWRASAGQESLRASEMPASQVREIHTDRRD